MYSYTVEQWILFFFIYCLVGWLWETIYESIKFKKYINRGFLHGPYLPIYGSGAIIMLFATLPVRNNLVLVFLFGAAAATALEYATGAALLAIFKTRYWDYSERWLNLNGHICFKCTVAWGLCAVALINLIHKPVEKVITNLDTSLAYEISTVLCIFFLIDLVISVNEALHLRAVIIGIAESEQVQEIVAEQKRKNQQYRFNRRRTIMLYVLLEELTGAINLLANDAERSGQQDALNELLWKVENAIEAERIMTHNKRLSQAQKILKRNPGAKLSSKLGIKLPEKINLKMPKANMKLIKEQVMKLKRQLEIKE